MHSFFSTEINLRKRDINDSQVKKFHFNRNPGWILTLYFLWTVFICFNPTISDLWKSYQNNMEHRDIMLLKVILKPIKILITCENLKIWAQVTFGSMTNFEFNFLVPPSKGSHSKTFRFKFLRKILFFNINKIGKASM